MLPEHEGPFGKGLIVTASLVLVVQVSALATHVWCTAWRHEWMFLVFGFVAYPVGVVHGMGVWLRLWS